MFVISLFVVGLDSRRDINDVIFFDFIFNIGECMAVFTYCISNSP